MADAAIAAVRSFVQSLNNPRPLAEARSWVLEGGLEVLHRGEGVLQSTIGAAIARAESNPQAARTEQALVEPSPEAWIYDDLGAVSSGYSIKVEGVEVFRGISVFSLLKTAEGWRISAISDVLTFHGGVATLESGADEDVITPIRNFLGHIKDREWDRLSGLVLPGGGACLSRPPEPPVVATWLPFFQRRKDAAAALHPGCEIKEEIHDAEVRRVGDFAFVWAPFDLVIDNAPSTNGVCIYTLLKRGGKWVISGLQDTSRPV